MSIKNETSELHITNILRQDKGSWVAASRKSGQKLADWAIARLNEAAAAELDLDKAPPINPADFKLVALGQIDDGATYDLFKNAAGQDLMIWHDADGPVVELDYSCYFGESEHEREQAFITELYAHNKIATP